MNRFKDKKLNNPKKTISLDILEEMKENQTCNIIIKIQIQTKTKINIKIGIRTKIKTGVKI